MDTEKSRMLLKIIETGSFSQAAELLGYTPSGINRMVKSMEDEIGFLLFTRSQKGVCLTTEGKRLLPIFGNLSIGRNSLINFAQIFAASKPDT